MEVFIVVLPSPVNSSQVMIIGIYYDDKEAQKHVDEFNRLAKDRGYDPAYEWQRFDVKVKF